MITDRLVPILEHHLKERCPQTHPPKDPKALVSVCTCCCPGGLYDDIIAAIKALRYAEVEAERWSPSVVMRAALRAAEEKFTNPTPISISAVLPLPADESTDDPL